MLETVAKALIAYLLGTVMGGTLVGRLRGGVDLRSQGSGNIGATNALRTQGPWFALAVLLIDVGKGVLAAGALPGLPGPWGAPLLDREQLGYLCGVAAALGHCYPVWYRFKGGKGVATLAGVFATVLPAALAWMLPAFALIVILTGYVSLASVTAAITALYYVTCVADQGVHSPAGLFTLAMGILVVFKHRANLLRLVSGTENRFQKAMIFRKWLRR